MTLDEIEATCKHLHGKQTLIKKRTARKGSDRGSAALGATPQEDLDQHLDKAEVAKSTDIFNRIISFRSKSKNMPDEDRFEIERAVAAYSNALTKHTK
jgi:hypothetical protein